MKSKKIFLFLRFGPNTIFDNPFDSLFWDIHVPGYCPHGLGRVSLDTSLNFSHECLSNWKLEIVSGLSFEIAIAHQIFFEVVDRLSGYIKCFHNVTKVHTLMKGFQYLVTNFNLHF